MMLGGVTLYPHHTKASVELNVLWTLWVLVGGVRFVIYNMFTLMHVQPTVDVLSKRLKGNQ